MDGPGGLQMLESIRGVGAPPVQAFALALLILAFFVLGFHGTVLSLVDRWTSPGTYSHGFLAIGVSIYCLWAKRGTLTHVSSRPLPAGIIAICLFGAGWLFAMLGNVLVVQQFSLVALLNAVVLTIYGWRGYRQLMFPLLTLFLVIPVWEYLELPLRNLATAVTYNIVQSLDIPVLREGYYLTVPGGSFFVDDACSGLGFFLCGLLLAFYFGYFNQLRAGQTALMLFLTSILAIAANWIRITGIILVGNATQMQHVIVTDHLMFGWIVFAVILTAFFLLGNFLFSHEIRLATNNDNPRPLNNTNQQTSKVLAAAVVPLVVAMCFPLLYGLHTYRELTPFPELTPPSRIPGGSPIQTSTTWRPRFKGAASTDMASYTFRNRRMDVFTVNYGAQSQGKELIHFANTLYEPARWSEVIRNPLADRDKGYPLLALNGPRNRSRLITYVYVLGNYTTSDENLAKLLDLINLIRGGVGASLLAVSIETRGSHQIKRDAQILTEFMQRVVSQLGISSLEPGQMYASHHNASINSEKICRDRSAFPLACRSQIALTSRVSR